MKDDSPQRKKSNQTVLIVMGFIWIVFALFGLIFDPEKRVITISQFVAGGLCFIAFGVLKWKSTKNRT